MNDIPQELKEAMTASLIDDLLKDYNDPEVQNRFKIWKKKREKRISEDLCLQG